MVGRPADEENHENCDGHFESPGASSVEEHETRTPETVCNTY